MAKLISYAQNFEDVILWRALSHVQEGCYVDVGAQSPDTDSVSRMFYEHGWRGVHVEPTPQYANLLRKRRPDEMVLQLAVSDRPGIVQFFNIADTGLSTTDPAVAEKHRAAGFDVVETRVPSVTLDAVLEQVQDRAVHWLKIDVEGAEHLVIEGWTAAKPQPWIVVVESTRPLSPDQSHERWEPAVLARGYAFAYFDGLNRFYVSDAHPELKAAFSAGPNVFDDFSLSPASQFCALVNLNYHKLKVQAEERQLADEARLRQRDAELHDLQQRLNACVAESKERQAEIVELAVQVDSGRKEAHRWWSAHEEMRDQLEAMSDLQGQLEAHVVENTRLRAEIADLTAQVDADAQETQHWRSAHGILAAEIDAILRDQQRIAAEHSASLARTVEQAQQEIVELATQIDASRQEAHRWWMAHDALRGQLDAMERSRSWQLTRPLRMVRNRLSANALVRLKHTLRPLALKSIRAVFALPRLHRMLKPMVAKVPFLYDRLYSIAIRERLYEDEQPVPRIEQLPLTVLEGNERDHTVVYLDKRAVRVLADLKQSRDGKAAQ